jgi:hypothetical protein
VRDSLPKLSRLIERLELGVHREEIGVSDGR